MRRASVQAVAFAVRVRAEVVLFIAGIRPDAKFGNVDVRTRYAGRAVDVERWPLRAVRTVAGPVADCDVCVELRYVSIYIQGGQMVLGTRNLRCRHQGL